jgi:MFS family permease
MFATWANFYVILGSAAGALIGLQFIVITLVAQRANNRVSPEAAATYASPTIVSFSVVLALSALGVMPIQNPHHWTQLWALAGAAGLVYSLFILFCMTRQSKYKPEVSDLVYFGILPCFGYALIAAAAYILHRGSPWAPFLFAAALLLLLLAGIRNAWDTVTYHVSSKSEPKSEFAPPGN